MGVAKFRLGDVNREFVECSLFSFRLAQITHYMLENRL